MARQLKQKLHMEQSPGTSVSTRRVGKQAQTVLPLFLLGLRDFVTGSLILLILLCSKPLQINQDANEMQSRPLDKLCYMMILFYSYSKHIRCMQQARVTAIFPSLQASCII
jgi:hypothetical protein